MHTTPYAVIDLETTGFGPSDRIIEIGVVLLDPDGNKEGTWECLIQPNRDIPNTFVHGISAADVVSAPTFREVAAHLQLLLEGRTMVAHNAPFEIRFLTNEFARLGVEFPRLGSHVVDTQRLSSKILPGGPRSLSDCLTSAGLSNSRPHAALSDAIATAELLGVLLERLGTSLDTRGAVHFVQRLIPQEFTAVTRSMAAPEPGEWIHRLAVQLPQTGDVDVDAYRKLLAASLADLELSSSEAAQLIAKAADLGISREEALELHEEFVHQLAVEAWLDGVITAEEAATLHRVAAQLGVDKQLVDALLATPTAGELPTRLVLHIGDRVAFTGELSLPRKQWEERARSAGLDVGGVAKKCVCLVAAQPDSQSGKARRARELEVPIIDETTFARLLSAIGAQDASNADLDVSSDIYGDDDFDRQLFPWLSQLELEVRGLADVAPYWINFHRDVPLKEISPLITPDFQLGVLENPRGMYEVWTAMYPAPFEATVADLLALRGVGKRKIDDAVRILVQEIVDYSPSFEPLVLVTPEPQQSAEESLLADVRLLWGMRKLLGHPTELGIELPESLATREQALRAQLAGAERGVFEESAAEIGQILSVDDRFAAIIDQRWVGGVTLEEIGVAFGVSRERIRQLEAQLTDLVQRQAPVTRAIAAIIAQRFLPLSLVDTVVAEIPELLRPVPGLTSTYLQLCESLAEDWEVTEGFLASPGLDDTLRDLFARSADAYGVVSLQAMAQQTGIPEQLLHQRIDSGDKFRYLVLGDRVLTAANSIQDRAAAMLAILGRPASPEEVLENLGGGKARTASNAFSVDPRLVRVTSEKWALKEWGLREFQSIAAWIGEEVDKTGSVSLESLLAQSAELDISPSSVRTYASTGEFIISDGNVMRGESEPVVDVPIEEGKNMFFQDGTWKLLLTVTADHLRGSGFGGPKALITYYEVPFLGEVTLSSDLGEQPVRFTRTGGAQIGTIKRFLDRMGASEGDRVWLEFGEDRHFAVSPALPVVEGLTGWDRVLNECGLDHASAASETEKIHRLNEALGLSGSAPRRRTVATFRHRGQDDFADLIQSL